jgi:hypothetical protein
MQTHYSTDIQILESLLQGTLTNYTLFVVTTYVLFYVLSFIDSTKEIFDIYIIFVFQLVMNI